MTPNLLVIFNVSAEDSVCELFLPYWRRSGCDLLFSSPLDAPSKLEFVDHVHFGRKLTDKAADYWFLQARMYETFKYCLSMPYEGFIFTHRDFICLGSLPKISRFESIHTLACGPTPQFESRLGLHPPYCFGIHRLKEFVEAATMEPIQLEHGIMDRWLPCVMQRHGLEFEPCLWSFSMNSIDTPTIVQAARQAISDGIVFLHGVKTKAQLDLILS